MYLLGILAKKAVVTLTNTCMAFLAILVCHLPETPCKWYFLIGLGTWDWGSWNQILLATGVPGTPAKYTQLDSQRNEKLPDVC